MSRVIVVGDIHGCIDEFDELMKAVQYIQGRDRLVLLGDLMDRGPDGVGVVRRAVEIGAESVLGNHCEAHLRWRSREALRLAGKGPNNMRPLDSKRLAENRALTDEDVAWLGSLPTTVRLNDSWLAVHAGFEPGIPFHAQDPGRMTRIRYVDGSTLKPVPMGEGFKQPVGSVYWTEAYRGRRSVVYGHFVHSVTEPRQDEPSPGVFCVGIDTGCVYGGRLTSMVMEPGSRPRFVQVQAKRRYAIMGGDRNTEG